jgi:hypothetical protein
VSLAVGLYFAFVKPSSQIPFSRLAQTQTSLAQSSGRGSQF